MAELRAVLSIDPIAARPWRMPPAAPPGTGSTGAGPTGSTGPTEGGVTAGGATTAPPLASLPATAPGGTGFMKPPEIRPAARPGHEAPAGHRPRPASPAAHPQAV
jgi:hypothetical protein